MANSYSEYRRWMRFIKEDHPKLPADISRATLLVIAWAIADNGNNGQECYSSDEVIARAVECNRKTVAKYRPYLLEYGWFVDTGRRNKRARIWDISIPDHDPRPFERTSKARNDNLGKLARPSSAWPSRAVSEPPSAKIDRMPSPDKRHNGRTPNECNLCRKVGELATERIAERVRSQHSVLAMLADGIDPAEIVSLIDQSGLRREQVRQAIR